MKRQAIFSGKGFFFALTVLAMSIAAVNLTADDIDSPPAAAQGATPAAPSVGDSDSGLLDSGFRDAFEGKFLDARKKLLQAGSAKTKNPTAVQAATVVQSYLERCEKRTTEAQKELDHEIRRMHLAFQAQSLQKQLEALPFVKELRKAVEEDLSGAYHDIPLAIDFEDEDAKGAQKLRSEAIEACEKSHDALTKGKALFRGKTGEFASLFEKQADELLEQISTAKKAWTASRCASPKDRWKSGKTIRTGQEDLADAVADLETLLSETPWKIALLHGRIALQIAPNPQAARKQPWAKTFQVQAESHGKKAMENEKWSDALVAYFALKEFNDGKSEYERKAKIAQRHVRVRRLYGDSEETPKEISIDVPEEGQKPRPPEKEKDPEEVEPEIFWKDLVDGVDAAMVRRAIAKLKDQYVTVVDFRKLARGALESVRVLAACPEVQKTFPGLKDDQKRKDFLTRIDERLKEIQDKDMIDQLSLIMALDHVLRSSEDTVEIPTEVLAVEFADGFLDELDPFSNMIWPHDVVEFNKQTMGRFTGIGVQITKKADESLRVASPLLGGPARKAGILAGDWIEAVNGEPTAPHSINELVKRIMGEPDSMVLLTIRRRGEEKPLEIPVQRGPVDVRTVKGWKRSDDGNWTYLLGEKNIAYLRITQFTDTTHRHVREALEQISQNASDDFALVLDLRGNPGGLLSSATDVVDEFISQGLIVSTRGRQTPKREINAHAQGNYLSGNLTILIDDRSASASEILSGALKDWHRGLIVGTRSYGKGSVQNVIPIRSQKAFLKLTTAHYYLPSGRLLHRETCAKDWGVHPDINVNFSPRQIRRWLGMQRKTDVLRKFIPELIDANLKIQYESDIQLDAAVTLLELMRLQNQIPSEDESAPVVAETSEPGRKL